MALVVKVGEAKTRLSELLHRVEAGEEVILSRGPIAIARLAPVDPGSRRALAFAEALEARDGGAAGPVTAAELGLWRGAEVLWPEGPSEAAEGPAGRSPPRVAAAADAMSRGFVLDPSFAAAWLLPGPDRAAADAAARFAKATALAPPGFWSGLGDLLLAAHRRGRIEAGFATAQLTRAGRLPISEIALTEGLGVEADGEARAALLRLALERGLSSRDAAYLGLARARKLPLATNAPALAHAAARDGLLVLTDLPDADLV